MSAHDYIPALGLRLLTPFYDTFVERPAHRIRQDILIEIGDLSSARILDVGCGTGSLAMSVQKTNPSAEVFGLDGDPRILEIARSKAQKQGLEIKFELGMSYQLPYPDASFDIVLTSFMLHHLSRGDKQKTANEMYRALRPGGRMLGVDFAEPRSIVGRSIRPLIRGFERVGDNLYGFLPVIFEQAGFIEFREIRRYVSGALALFQCDKRS